MNAWDALQMFLRDFDDVRVKYYVLREGLGTLVSKLVEKMREVGVEIQQDSALIDVGETQMSGESVKTVLVTNKIGQKRMIMSREIVSTLHPNAMRKIPYFARLWRNELKNVGMTSLCRWFFHFRDGKLPIPPVKIVTPGILRYILVGPGWL